MTMDVVGTWRVVYSELNGEMSPVAHFSSVAITYKPDGTFSIEAGGSVEHEGNYSIDESVVPAQITYTYTKSSFFDLNKPRLGIIQLTANTLKDCLGAIGDPPPADFNTKDGDDTVLTVHRRAGQEGGGSVTVSASRRVAEW